MSKADMSKFGIIHYKTLRVKKFAMVILEAAESEDMNEIKKNTSRLKHAMAELEAAM